MSVEKFRNLYKNKRTEDIYTIATLALNAQVVVELGTGSGISAKAFLKGLKQTGGTLYSIDNLNYPQVPHAISLLSDEKQVTFIQGDSVEKGKTWDKGNIDILLCDSDHSESHVMNELETWSRFHPKITFIHDMIGPVQPEEELKFPELVRPPNMKIAPPYLACKKYAKAHNKVFVALLNIFAGLGIIVDEENQLDCLGI